MGNQKYFLSKQLHSEIVSCFARGYPSGQVAVTVGLPPAVLKRWLRNGEDPDSEYHPLKVEVMRAQGMAHGSLVDALYEHALSGDKNSYKSAQWLLSRSNSSWQEGGQIKREKKEALDDLRIQQETLKLAVMNHQASGILGHQGTGEQLTNILTETRKLLVEQGVIEDGLVEPIGEEGKGDIGTPTDDK